MPRLRSPILWFGGKGNMTKKLLPLIPPHNIYVEPFGGGASLLFAKPPSPVEVYNDIDSGLVNFFRVLRDPEKFAKFYHLACLTPYSREEYYHARKNWGSCEDEVERAHLWFTVARMSFSGRFGGSWGFAVTASNRGMADVTSRYLSTLERLPEIHARLMRVQIEHNDFRKVIITYDTPETFFYLDPPYLHRVRSGGKYAHEMSDDDHEDLVKMLLGLKGRALLSGYPNDLYRPLEEAGWHTKSWNTACSAAGCTRRTGITGEGAARRMQPRTERVWYNYELPGETIPLTDGLRR